MVKAEKPQWLLLVAANSKERCDLILLSARDCVSVVPRKVTSSGKNPSLVEAFPWSCTSFHKYAMFYILGIDFTRKTVKSMDCPTRRPKSIPLWHGQLKGQVPAPSPLSQSVAHSLKQEPSGSQVMAHPQPGLSRLKLLTKLSRPRHM